MVIDRGNLILDRVMNFPYRCNKCPGKFQSFKALKNHYESEHNPESEQYRKLRDSITYSGKDSGCKVATEYLGEKPSKCLKCPFRKCVLDKSNRGVGIATIRKRQRNEEMRGLFKEGKKVKELATMFGISTRTVKRVLRV